MKTEMKPDRSEQPAAAAVAFNYATIWGQNFLVDGDDLETNVHVEE